jgi:hypothetical protein
MTPSSFRILRNASTWSSSGLAFAENEACVKACK